MVVCKYFMEGYCKFGLRCKFDHVDPYSDYDAQRRSDYSSERPQGTSILKAASSTNSSFGRQEFSHSPQQQFVQPQQQGFGFNQTLQHSFGQPSQHGFNTPPQHGSFAQKPSGMKYNVQEMLQVVLRDVSQMEKGGQWQLSCYSPLKDLPNMPGLEDYSPEELRWEFYKAVQNGSLPLCQAIVQQLFGNIAKINNELKRKETGYSIVDRWLRDSEQRAQNASVEQPAAAFASPFGGNTNTSALSSPFFAPNSPQVQQPPPSQLQQGASSFSFSLSPQQPPPPAPPFQQHSSPFSSNPNSAFVSHSVSPFSSPTQASVEGSQVYSSIASLADCELEAFKADRFILGSIPTKPPPRELCNL